MPFFAGINLEKVGSSLAHFSILELVSQLSNCIFMSSRCCHNHLLPFCFLAVILL